jgi:hypothetical protein
MVGQPPTACHAPAVFAEMRSATGGAAWSRIGEIAAIGSVRMSGLRGTARFDDDLRLGRYAQRFDVAVMGSSAEVYDGRTVWAQDISGGVHPYDSEFPKERSVTSNYLTRRAYFDPQTGATFTCLGTRNEDGREVTVIRVQPRGGIPAQLSVDSRTHLIASVSERLPLTNLVVRYGDYRTVEGVALPFTITSGTLAEPADGFALHVKAYDVRPHPSDEDFARPAFRNDVTMLRGTHRSVVPVTLDGRQLLIWASIDGRAAMPFILDTGGHAILTSGAAKKLGLQGAGAGESGGSGSGTIALQYTRVKTLRIGTAQLKDQPFLVIPYSYSFYERAHKPPLAGILGLEVFERFATRIDYAARTVTFTPLTTYAYRGTGRAIPFRFQDDMPMVHAWADGHRGLFGVDTGNAGSLILFGTFLRRTGLLERYPGGCIVIGHGTGGSNTGRLSQLRQFSIAGHTLENVPADFTQMTSGAFSSWTEAGNMGYEVLAHFIPTFDYARQALYLDSSPNARPRENRSGMGFTKDDPSSFTVTFVCANMPASEAGITPGDRITTVNGEPASNYSWADLMTLVSRSNHASLRLGIQRGQVARVLTLQL